MQYEDDGENEHQSDVGWCSAGSGISSSEYSDWVEDGESNCLQPPKRRSKRKVQTHRFVICFTRLYFVCHFRASFTNVKMTICLYT